MLLGIPYHAALSFTDPPILGWAVQDRSHHQLVWLFVWCSHAFRMPLFFLVSGFFARLLLIRSGLAGFMRNRIRRVALPFAGAYIILMPILAVLWIWPAAAKMGLELDLVDTPSVLGQLDDGQPVRLNPAHLWFLYYLIQLYVLVAIAVEVTKPMNLKVLVAMDRLYERVLRSSWAPFIAAVPTTLVLYSMSNWFSFDSPSEDFVPKVRLLAYFGLFFVFGWWMHRRVDLVSTLKHKALRYLLFVAPLAGVVWALLPLELDVHRRYYPWVELAVLSMTAAVTWSMILGLLGLAVHFADYPNRRLRWLADASYFFYLAHLPIVVALQVILAENTAPGFVKFVAIDVSTILVLALLYRYCIRYTIVGRILNGPRSRAHDISESLHPAATR